MVLGVIFYLIPRLQEVLVLSIIEIVCGVGLILFAVSIILVVLFQEGQQQNMGAIGGGAADTFLAKNKSRSIDTFLARWTKFIAIGFFALVVLANAISFFKLFGAS